jgi:hypothetical protein
MLRIINTSTSPIKHIDDWRLKHSKVVIGGDCEKWYILTYIEHFGYMFKNVFNAEYGSNGWHPSAEQLVSRFLNFDKAEVYEFDSVMAAMDYIKTRTNP